MKRLCIIPCGKKKIWDVQPDAGPVRAEDAYLSPFHQACERYAKTFFDEWVILSAKHGFLRPDDLVSGNYDVTFGTGHPEIMTADELRRQFHEKGFSDIEELVMLGGKKYRSKRRHRRTPAYQLAAIIIQRHRLYAPSAEPGC
ncbi:hypothetical protein NRS6118_04480 [Bacillus subtilis]|nr:hypothetical protein NRS6118_03239 [Bacillus subtilis]CAI6238712.1 hypothetical protein NRS6118_04480 [Bacillus subtilis]